METFVTYATDIVKFVRPLVLATACLCAHGVWADQKSNWLTAGGGDLATYSNWSLGESTYWSDSQGSGSYVSACFAPISPYTPLTFTASSDVTFANFWFQSESTYPYQEYVLDIGKDRTLYFNGTADGGIWIGVNNGKKCVVRFKSGNYKIRDGATGQYRFRHTTQGGACTSIVESASTRIELGQVDFSGYFGSMLCVTNGGYISGKLMSGGSGANIRNGVILISGRDADGTPSIYDGKDNYSYVFDNDNAGGGFTMLVNDGGVVTNFCAAWGNRGSNAKMVIDGSYYYGSSNNNLNLGANRTGSSGAYTGWPTNNSVTVKNGGYFTMPKGRQIAIGGQGNNNWVSVESGSEMNVDHIFLGDSGNSNQTDDHNYGNRLSVSGGAYLNIYGSLQAKSWSFGHEIDIGGAGTRVDIRRDPRGEAGGGIYLAASNTVMRIHDGAVVTNYELSAGTRLLNNVRLEVLSGAELCVENGVGQGYDSATSNSFVLVEGGRILVPSGKTYQVGTTSMTSERDWNNTLWVGDGGTLETYRLRVFGYGNALVISNGTVDVGFEFRTTYQNTEESGGRTRMTFAGSHPRFLMRGKYLNFQREGIIRFEIPRGGYTTVPFEQTGAESGYWMSIAGDCAMEFDVHRYARGGGGTLTLMKSNLTIVISDSQMEKLRKGLPEGSTLFLTDDKTELRLNVRSTASMTVVVR